MALIACYECTKEISDTAQSCPGCGAPVKPRKQATGSWKPSDHATDSWKHQPANRMVSLPLFLGIVVLAPICVWFLLRKGYSTQSRVIGFAWLVISFFFVPIPDAVIPGSSTSTRQAASTTISSATSRPVEQHPESTATYAQVNADVGCKSIYSDQKKDDMFKAKYKDHWMTWGGEVVLLESDQASLNVDGVGIQDLTVYFADKQAGYNLSKGNQLKVRFLMKSAGGCFLPFTGREATIAR